MLSPYWNWAAVLLAGGCLFIAAKQTGVLGAVAFRYNVLFTPSAVLLVWLLAMGKGFISRLLSAKPFLWLAQLSPYGFLIHQVLIRYMEWTADKFSLTVQPVVWTLTVFLLTLCLSWFYKALERRVRQLSYKRLLHSKQKDSFDLSAMCQVISWILVVHEELLFFVKNLSSLQRFQKIEQKESPRIIRIRE